MLDKESQKKQKNYIIFNYCLFAIAFIKNKRIIIISYTQQRINIKIKIFLISIHL